MRLKVLAGIGIGLFLVSSVNLQAETVYFLVAEQPGYESHLDSYVLPLSDPADIAHARDLIAFGPGIGGTIAVAKIAAGANGIQVGTAFAFCRQSGTLPEIKHDVIDRYRNGRLAVTRSIRPRHR